MPYPATTVSCVWLWINAAESVIPIRANIAKLQNERKIAVLAALSDLSNLFSPSDFESRAFTPTPVPEATAIIRFCRGNASVTAVRASSLSLATKMLSTIL